MKKLILIRHGESIWNLKNLYTGWVNINLTEKGINQANQAKLLLIENNIKPDVIFSSNLERSINTSKIIFPNFKAPVPQTKKMVIRKRYWLYYLLQFTTY